MNIPPLLLWENIVIDGGKGGFIVPPSFAPILRAWVEEGYKMAQEKE